MIESDKPRSARVKLLRMLSNMNVPTDGVVVRFNGDRYSLRVKLKGNPSCPLPNSVDGFPVDYDGLKDLLP